MRNADRIADNLSDGGTHDTLSNGVAYYRDTLSNTDADKLSDTLPHSGAHSPNFIADVFPNSGTRTYHFADSGSYSRLSKSRRQRL